MDIYKNRQIDFITTDKTGVGQGVYDRLNDMGYPIRGVAFGEKSESDMFQNLKAEWHWRERQWLLSGGRLIKNPAWEELRNIRYKNKDGKIIMQPKEDLLRMGIASPNVVDAAVLTMVVNDTSIRNNRIFKARGNYFKDDMQKIWRG